MLETDPDKVEFKDGRFRSDTSQRSFDVFEIARAAQTLNDLDDDLRGPLSAESDQHFTDGGYPYGAPSARSRSSPTPARSRSCAIPRSTTSAARSIR